jgi:non-homologous end joining protein Ku
MKADKVVGASCLIIGRRERAVVLEPRTKGSRGWNPKPLQVLRTDKQVIAQLKQGISMNNLIWLVGAVVIVIAILSFFGLR